MPDFRAVVGALAVACVVLLPPSRVMAADVTVFAAASLKESMDEQARRFEAVTGNKVIVSYGGSNALAKQIESGAPADVFISADLDWMDYLDQRKLLAANSRSNAAISGANVPQTTPRFMTPATASASLCPYRFRNSTGHSSVGS